MRLRRRSCPVAFQLVAQMLQALVTREKSHKIDAHDELCFTPPSALNFDGRCPVTIYSHARVRSSDSSTARDAVRWTITTAISRRLRRTSHCRVAGRVTYGMALWRICPGVDGRWMVRKRLLTGDGWHGARRSWCVRVVRVTWRPTKLILALIHGEAGGGRVVVA